MGDQADQAGDLIDAATERALTGIRARQGQGSRVERKHSSGCAECGDHIPLARLAAVDTELCVRCQEDQEARTRRQ